MKEKLVNFSPDEPNKEDTSLPVIHYSVKDRWAELQEWKIPDSGNTLPIRKTEFRTGVTSDFILLMLQHGAPGLAFSRADIQSLLEEAKWETSVTNAIGAFKSTFERRVADPEIIVSTGRKESLQYTFQAQAVLVDINAPETQHINNSPIELTIPTEKVIFQQDTIDVKQHFKPTPPPQPEQYSPTKLDVLRGDVKGRVNEVLISMSDTNSISFYRAMELFPSLRKGLANDIRRLKIKTTQDKHGYDLLTRSDIALILLSRQTPYTDTKILATFISETQEELLASEEKHPEEDRLYKRIKE
jgi:hypothetical protein